MVTVCAAKECASALLDGMECLATLQLSAFPQHAPTIAQAMESVWTVFVNAQLILGVTTVLWSQLVQIFALTTEFAETASACVHQATAETIAPTRFMRPN